jgi:hypothetical protein
MPNAGATSYRVSFVGPESALRDVYASLPVLLLGRIVPARMLGWLAEDPHLMQDLLRFLSDAKPREMSVIRTLVERAQRYVLRPARLDDASPLPSERPESTPPMTTPRVKSAVIETERVTTSLCNTAQGRSVNEGIAHCDLVHTATIESLDSITQPQSPDAIDASAEPPDQGKSVPPSAQRPANADLRTLRGREIVAQFMDWLRQGLAQGSIEANVSGALVHFVPEGMLLVSPRVFTAFVAQHAEQLGAEARADQAKWVQRQLRNAGLNLHDESGKNVLAYDVVRHGQAMSRIWGVVIKNPERFVSPVLAANPFLIRAPVTMPSA